MISRLGQAMPRFLAGTSVAGVGMRERLQAATFAMFGVVTAIGLVLVGIAYNQSWPDFADSPIPILPTERIGGATVAAGALHGHSGSGNVAASHRSLPGGRTGAVPDRLSAAHGSPQQQLPTPAPGVPGTAPSGHGGVEVPASHAPAPAGHAPAPAAPAPVAAQPAPAPVPVAAAPPAAEPADAASVPGNGKAKGHEKTEKPAKPHGRTAPVTPVAPPPPSVPAPGSATPETSGPAPGPGNGKGNAKGHEK
jgi:hypothetical protein